MATLITGATGFVGKHLLNLVDKPIVTSRNRERALKKLGDRVTDVIEWDPMSGPLTIPSDTQVECVMNLMGESIAEGRWNAAKKKRIRDSRILGTQNLIQGLRTLDKLPSSLISASAVGIYGDQGNTLIDESNTDGEGYLVEVCRDWEAAANEFQSDGVRVALIRIGIVLGRGGGAIEKMLPIIKLGIGGTLGNGSQYVPWIHVRDVAEMFHWSAENLISGPLNAAAPNPVTNREMTKALGKALSRPTFLPAPKFALKLALGEFADSLLFSQRVIPKIPLDRGFEFQYETIEQAIRDLV